MHKVIALTGEICSGKSSALCFFKLQGARIVSTDMLTYMVAKNRFLESNEIRDLLQKQIDEYHHMKVDVPLVIETHLWVVEEYGSMFDDVVLVEALTGDRVKWGMERMGMSYLNAYWMMRGKFKRTFKVSKIFRNHGSKEELAQQIKEYCAKKHFLRNPVVDI